MAKRTKAVKRGAVVAASLTSITFSFDITDNAAGSPEVGILLSEPPQLKGTRKDDLSRFLAYVAQTVQDLITEGLAEASAPSSPEQTESPSA